IAPAARTRMTETVFAEMMAKPASGFDAMAPENVSPLVVWLGSAEARDVTGRVFEIAGGKLQIADGWRTGGGIDKGARFTPGAVAPGSASPAVVWLGCAGSRDVTGRVFEIAGGKLQRADGWRTGVGIDKGARFTPGELGPIVRDLLGKATPAQKVYGT